MFKTRANLGQHFLTDKSIAQKIAQSAGIESDDVVVEIGPGKGFLTQRLLDQHPKQLIAIEKDGELHHSLKKRFRDYENLLALHQDIRDLDIENLPAGYKLVANIPYYLTGKIIRDFLDHQNRPQVMVLLIQKEVAERLTASKGQGSLLQMTVQNFAEVENILSVPAEKFDPPPQVDSSVVKFSILSVPKLEAGEQKKFFKLLKFAFAGKRKTLFNTVGKTLKIHKAQFEQILKENKILLTARPQELDFNNWLDLYTALNQFGYL